MSETKTIRWRPLATGLAVGALLVGVTGCGDDDEDTTGGGAGGSDAPAALAISATEGAGGKSEITAPGSAAPGVTEITLTNEGKKPHSAQLLRVEGDHSEAEVFKGLEAAMKAKAFPEWFFAGGGVATVKPGETGSVTQELEAGSTYWLVDDEAKGKPPLSRIDIEGEAAGAELPSGPQTVKAVDFDFEVDGPLKPGEAIRFDNTGAQPHHIIASPIKKGKTLADVEQFFKDEKGPPPIDFEAGNGTSVLEGGTSQIWNADLKPGSYALVCFISNRDGGPPHVAFGMLEEVEVE